MMNTTTTPTLGLALRPRLNPSQPRLLSLPRCELPDAPPLAALLPALDKTKQAELQKAVAMIVEATQPRNNQHDNNAMMIRLFGGYARGNWVEKKQAGENPYAYQSSFDLLVIVKNEAIAKKLERKRSLHNRLRKAIQTPIHIVVEEIHLVNLRLGKGNYFFTDLIGESVVLYDSGALSLTPPEATGAMASGRCLVERKTLAQRDFDHWFAKANTYKQYAQIAINRGDANEAAFFLHQSVERFYHAMLLTFVRYRPNTHNLKTLNAFAASLEPQFATVFPQGREEEKHAFDVLCQAYVNARYRPNFHITQPQLTWLSARVDYLQTQVKQHCQQRIAEYR